MSSLSVASVSSTSIIVNVNLTRLGTIAGDLSGETLYCIGLNNGSMPSSVGSIKSAATDGASTVGASVVIPVASTYPLLLNVPFSGLMAVKAYVIYCYVESSTGVGTTLSVVKLQKLVVSTICCKVVNYINYPSIIYVGSTPSVFTYALSALPSVGTSIIVTPVLYLDGALTNNVQVTPSSTPFYSSFLLSGSFIVSATTSGNLTIILSVTGSNSAQYYNRSSTVLILPSFITALPAPKMMSSRFSVSGQAVVITFDTPTDSAGIVTSTWRCSQLFTFVSSFISTCAWTTASTVMVTFNGSNSNVYLTPGGIVTLIGGQLRALCSASALSCAKNSAAPTASLSTLVPTNPSTPTVVLSSPTSLGSCANLVLDATGSYGNGGRLYSSVQWTVSAKNGSLNVLIDVANMTTYLNTYSSTYQVSTPVIIVAKYLQKASYTITLSLTNFFNRTSSASITVAITSDHNVPSLSIIGPSYTTMVASSPLTILSIAALSSCADSGLKVAFAWAVTIGSPPVSTTIKSSSLDQSQFFLAPYKLAVNMTYTMTVTASTGTSSVSASTIVYVAQGVVTAAIVGGYVRSVPVNEALQLDASISSDSDASPSSVSTLSYQVM